MEKGWQDIINIDKEKYPHCFYSFASSRSCSSTSTSSGSDSKKDSDEAMTCNVMRQIYRLCPGEDKKVIYSASSVDKDFPSVGSFGEKGVIDPSIFDQISDLPGYLLRQRKVPPPPPSRFRPGYYNRFDGDIISPTERI